MIRNHYWIIYLTTRRRYIGLYIDMYILNILYIYIHVDVYLAIDTHTQRETDGRTGESNIVGREK